MQATFHSPTEAGGQTDKELIADIAPAMLDKLKLEGKFVGSLFAFLIIIAAPGFGFLDPLETAISAALHLGPDGPRCVADFVTVFGVLACFTLLPWHFGRNNIKAELKYRCQHGKWRWEH